MITVCVPLFDPHPKFLRDFTEFYAANKVKHDLRLGEGSLSGRAPTHLVMGKAVDTARENGSTHILFVEDDHWRFPHDGLDVLLEADLDAVGFATLARSFPYHALAMNRIDRRLPIIQSTIRNMAPAERTSHDSPVIQEVDVVTWAMCLVKADVFFRIEDPFEAWGQVANDSIFAHHCEQATPRIQRHVHFGCVLPHADVQPEHRLQLQQLHNFKIALERNPATAAIAGERFRQFTNLTQQEIENAGIEVERV